MINWKAQFSIHFQSKDRWCSKIFLYGAMIFWDDIFSISTFPKSLKFGTVLYKAWCTGCVFSSKSLIRCFLTHMRPGWPSPVTWSWISLSMNSVRYTKKFWIIWIFYCQSCAMRFESQPCMTVWRDMCDYTFLQACVELHRYSVSNIRCNWSSLMGLIYTSGSQFQNRFDRLRQLREWHLEELLCLQYLYVFASILCNQKGYLHWCRAVDVLGCICFLELWTCCDDFKPYFLA